MTEPIRKTRPTRDEVFATAEYVPGTLRSYPLLDVEPVVTRTPTYGAYIGIEDLLRGADTPAAAQARRKAAAWTRLQAC
jgi:hypothetical protein